MNRKKAKIKLNVAVYAILLLLAVVLLFASHNASAEGTWSQLLNGLSVELLGSVVLFLVAQYFFIWNEDVEKRNDRLDQFLIRNEQDSNSSVFVIEKESKSNDKFYDYFNERISKARYDIYITGEGFESKDSKEFAIDFFKATEAAIQNGVNVVRLQTTSTVSGYWADLLKKHLAKENFTLYLTDSSWSRGSLCSIDCTDHINNVTEYMLSVSRSSGMDESSLAGLAVFVRNNSDLANDVMQLIKSRCNDEKHTTSINLGNFDEHIKSK